MSNDNTTETNNTTTEVDNNVNQEEVFVEEPPKVYELTATDHINKNMLEMFKQRLESGQFQFNNQAEEEESDDEFKDDENQN